LIVDGLLREAACLLLSVGGRAPDAWTSKLARQRFSAGRTSEEGSG
jgi:hypothetical protein